MCACVHASLCACLYVCLDMCVTTTEQRSNNKYNNTRGEKKDQFISHNDQKKAVVLDSVFIKKYDQYPPPHPPPPPHSHPIPPPQPPHLSFFPCLQDDSSPQKLSQVDDVWNCTGRQWPEFRVHLQCNSYLQCAGGEDEAECRYRRCHQTGVGVQVADKCYMLGRPHAPLSWIQASHTCQLHGGHLASIRSSEHIDYLKDFFRYLGWRTVHVFIGLQTASLSLPDM